MVHDPDLLDDEARLDVAFDRALWAIEDGSASSYDDLVAGRPDLRPRLAEVVRLAQAFAMQRAPVLPRIAGYDVLHELGRGAMGVVYLARHHALARLVALKVLPGAGGGAHLAARPRFLAEARAMAKVRHPHVVQIHDVIEDPEQCAFAMEYVQGCSLASVLAAVEPLPPAARLERAESLLGTTLRGDRGWTGFVVRLGAEIAEALAAVHALGLVHRDVKPSNILVRHGGEGCLADFGLVHDEASTDLTRSGQFVGTLLYAAPEQLAGRRDQVGPRSDVYSLGVTLYHALVLRAPYAEPTTPRMLARIETGQAPRLRRADRGLSRDLELLVAKAMDPEPSHRYQRAEDLALDLRRVLAFEPVAARRPGLAVRLRRWVRRHPSLAAVLTAGTLAVAAGAALLDHQARSAAREAQVPTDVVLVAGLLDEVPRLLPGGEARIAGLQRWLSQARPLLERVAEYRVELRALEARLPAMGEPSPAERAALEAAAGSHELERERRARLRAALDHGIWGAEWLRDWLRSLEQRAAARARAPERQVAFASLDQRERHAQLWRLADQGAALEDAARLVEQRLGDAQRGDALCRASFDDLWAQTRRWLEQAEARLRYPGLDLQPQSGLVPLGRDPESGLLEFAHLATGDVPLRDPQSGRLDLGPANGIVLVLIPGGEVTIGARHPLPGEVDGIDHRDSGAEGHEQPPGQVLLEPFFLSKLEMTQAQWQRVTGDSPSWYAAGMEVDGRVLTGLHPVESVSWEEAWLLVETLGLTLPTDAQWECATRGGTRTRYWSGPEVGSLEGCENLHDAGSLSRAGASPEEVASLVSSLNAVPWDDGWRRHAPVGSFRPNAYGLHDTQGNVSEYCLELTRARMAVLNSPARPRDGLRDTGPASWEAVVRGASWLWTGHQSRSSFRLGAIPNMRNHDTGLRPARRVEPVGALGR